VLNNTIDCVDYYTVVLAAQVDTQGKLRVNPEPFLTLNQYQRVCEHLANSGKLVWLKPQLHPHPRTHDPTCKPTWWPGYVKCPSISVLHWNLVAVILAKRHLPTWQIEAIVAGTELAGMVNEVPWQTYLKILRAYAPHAMMLYGANFWQPIAWYFRGWIKFLIWLGLGESILKQLLNRTPFADTNPKVLLDILKRGIIQENTALNFDKVGLSCYFWPSMVCDRVKIAEAYQNYTFKLNWLLKWSICYPQLAMSWSTEINRDWSGLIVTESGPVYMSPIGKQCGARATDWWLITMREFERVGCTHFTIWEDLGVGSSWEALKAWR